jgi:putative DNA primase/helicase
MTLLNPEAEWLPPTPNESNNGSGNTANMPRPIYGLNDTGNADRLADTFGEDLIYCHERQAYYVWTGRRWQIDGFIQVERRAEQTIRNAYAEAGSIGNSDNRKMFLSFLNKSLSRNSLANMTHLAKKKVRGISATELDCDPWLLNVENGTIDLKTGNLRPHLREDLISKLIPLQYDPSATCPRFMEFIFRIMGDGPDASAEAKERADRLVQYLQRLFGCAATGRAEKILAVFYGQRGNNGKTTLLTTISRALGDREYGTQINIDSLMADPRGMGGSNAVNSDLADLQGARFVFTSEVDKGQRLSLGRVKYLTGLTHIRTRRLRENWIDFPPTHKLFMDCNDRPVISSPTDAVWNRLVCVPFDVVIPDDEIDTELPRKLEAELPGILAWIVEGALNYGRDGLKQRPPEVRASTADYREISDRLKEFLEDCCSIHPDAWAPWERIARIYEEWCRKNGEKYPLSRRDITDHLRVKGCEPKSKTLHGKLTRGWAGIEVLASVQSPDGGKENYGYVIPTPTGVDCVEPPEDGPDDASR